jgi:multiple sugar transport system ATP-binding protein
MASVTMRGIRKSYDNALEVIKGVDLDVHDGEFMVFVGPSGCGKSTMMRMVAGLEGISAGELRIGDKIANDLPAPMRGVAMVFQSYALYPHMTVAENMGFSLKMAKVPKAQAREQVERAAEVLQITHLLDRTPKALSGGQRQRVAIGRAIVRKPEVFLFDEPLSNLDAGLRVQMRVELTKLHKELGSTMIYVTHDQVEAMTMGDRIAVFNAGRIEQVGTPLELYQRPANVFVAQFLGSPKMNVLAGDAQAVDGGVRIGGASAGFVLPANAATAALQSRLSDVAQVGIRPESLTVAAASAGEPGWSAKIDVIEHLGDTVLIYASVAGVDQPVSLKLAAEEGEPWLAGMAVTLHPKSGALHLFDAQGQRIGAI